MIERRLWRAVVLLAAGAVTAACAAMSGNPDPGNRWLHAAAADPIFTGLPLGAVRTNWQEQSAKYHNRGIFEGSGWSGPDIILTFTSSQSARDVFRFYAERAHETGWTPTQTLPIGLTWDWSKHIAGKKSHIVLKGPFGIHSKKLIPYVDVNWAESGIPMSYSLNAY
jgi:hypothetical protein